MLDYSDPKAEIKGRLQGVGSSTAGPSNIVHPKNMVASLGFA